MKRLNRIISLALVFLMTLPLSSCFHNNWNIPEREEPDFNLGELFGAIAPVLGGVEIMPGGIELELSEDGSYFTIIDASKCTAKNLTLPESYKGVPIKAIGEGAFENVASLAEITIPDSVVSVGSNAFGGCSSLKYNEYDGSHYLGNENNPYRVLVSVTQNSLSSKMHKDTRIIADSACASNRVLKELVVPDGVLAIGNRAFANCQNLYSVIIGDSVESIGDSAFNKAPISKLSLGSSVKIIGKQAFFSASSLASLIIPDSVTEIGPYAFSVCSSLEKVWLGEGLRTIGEMAFAYCDKLTDISFGGSLERIGEEAFRECRALEKLSLPHKIEHIAYNSFYECSRLTYNTYANGVYLGSDENPYEYLVEINDSAEMEISELVLHSDTRRIVKPLFCYYNVKKLSLTDGKYLSVLNNCLVDTGEGKIIAGIAGATIPPDANITSISDYAFYCIKGLTLRSIPVFITSIGAHAFENCTDLGQLVIRSAAPIGDYAFMGCSSLTSVTFHEQTKYIGDYAFSSCRSLTKIGIPDTVEYLGKSAFEGCTEMTEAYIGSRVSKICERAFANCINLETVNMGGAPKSIADQAFYMCHELKYFEFKEGLEYIGNGAFYICERLSYISLPESLIGIGEKAFSGCKRLQWVNLGTGLKTIRDGAFNNIPLNIEFKYNGTLKEWSRIENANNLYLSKGNIKVICTDGEIVLEPDEVIIVLD